MTGLFISFEGIDGSGKSTQARMLAAALRAEGHAVTLTREPGGSPGAEEIRRLVLEGDPDRWSAETEILLFTAARRDHLEKTILPALARGDIVITDRFADSTRMYQGITRGDLRSTVDALHDLMIGREPDLTLVIDMDPREALGRSLKRLAEGQSLAAASMAAQTAFHAATGDAAEAANSAAEAAAAAQRAESLGIAVKMIDEKWMPEDRFETFGPLFQGFLELAKTNKRFHIIDGARDADTVAADVRAACNV
jgi:dTMP kinase